MNATSLLRSLRRAVGLTTAVAVLVVATAGAASARQPFGVDVSHWQHHTSLDWSAVADDGVSFAFIKATEGRTWTDPAFAADWTATRQVGILRGAYHFGRPSRGSAAAQARHFARVIGPQNGRGTLPPVLDLESSGGLGPAALRTWTRTFLTTVEDLTGRTPIIYCSPYFWDYYLGGATTFHRYPLWVAHYGVSSPRVPGGWPTWTFWQGTSTGKVRGIHGIVDMDAFNGSLAALQKLALAYDPVVTTTSLAVDTTTPLWGRKVRFTGTLTEPDGAPVARAAVRLEARVVGDGPWREVVTLRTGAAGGYATSRRIMQGAEYRAVFAGDEWRRPSQSTAAAVTPTPVPSRLRLDASATEIQVDERVQLSGNLVGGTGLAPLADKSVAIEQQVAGGPWRPVRVLETADDGTFSALVAPVGEVAYRARFVDGRRYADAVSATRAVVASPHPSALTLESRPTAYRNQQVRLHGRLVAEISGKAEPNARRRVVLMAKPLGGQTWRRIGAATTDDDGGYSLRVRVSEPLRIEARFVAGPRFTTATSQRVSITLTPPQKTVLTLPDRLSDRTLEPRHRQVRLGGTLTTAGGAALAHRRVRVLTWSKEGSWRRVAGVLTDRRGHWSTRVGSDGRTRFRVAFHGGGRYRAASTPVLRVARRA